MFEIYCNQAYLPLMVLVCYYSYLCTRRK